MASSNEGYWSKSWALLTRDKGWFKPLLVLSAAHLVPVVGAFGASGYALEWARLTSWGVDSSPKQKNVNVSECIRTGARAFVVALAFGLVVGFVNKIVEMILGDTLGSLLSLVITLFASVLITVATLRATIYQSIGAGFEVNRLADMIKRDHKGLLRIVGLNAALGAVIGLICAVLFSIIMIATMGDLVGTVIASERYGSLDDWDIVMLVAKWITGAFPLLCVFGYVVGVLGAFANLITTTAVGLWMRQFDVRNWGASSDPLPATAPAGQAAGWGAPATNGYTPAPTGSATPAATPDAAGPAAYNGAYGYTNSTDMRGYDQSAAQMPIPEAREVPLDIPTGASPTPEAASSVMEMPPIEAPAHGGRATAISLVDVPAQTETQLDQDHVEDSPVAEAPAEVAQAEDAVAEVAPAEDAVAEMATAENAVVEMVPAEDTFAEVIEPAIVEVTPDTAEPVEEPVVVDAGEPEADVPAEDVPVPEPADEEPESAEQPVSPARQHEELEAWEALTSLEQLVDKQSKQFEPMAEPEYEPASYEPAAAEPETPEPVPAEPAELANPQVTPPVLTFSLLEMSKSEAEPAPALAPDVDEDVADVEPADGRVVEVIDLTTPPTDKEA